MYSDAVNSESTGHHGGAAGGPSPAAAAAAAAVAGASHVEPVFARWIDWRPARISHHAARCCEAGLAWLQTHDFAERRGGPATLGPRWLTARYKWGPFGFPAFWCDAVRRKTLDCGAFAAFAFECFRAREVTVFRAQVVQRYDAGASEHWRRTWRDSASPPDWLGDGGVVYHEACAVEKSPGNLRLWDPSAACWLDPATTSGYGAVLAVRIADARSSGGARLRWGDHLVTAEEWCATG